MIGQGNLNNPHGDRGRMPGKNAEPEAPNLGRDREHTIDGVSKMSLASIVEKVFRLCKFLHNSKVIDSK
jgi:hypothetical protein